MNAAKSAAAFDKMLRTPPEEAARLIVDAIRHDQRRLLIGNDAKVLDLMQRIVPQGYQKVFSTLTKMQSRSHAKKAAKKLAS
jgi:hypothetical protein